MHRRSLALTLLVPALVLAGCSASSVATRTEPGVPDRFIAGENLLNGDPVALFAEGELAVITFGSSSCPPVPTSIGSPDPKHVVIDFSTDLPDDQPCTADLAPTTHWFALPGDVKAGQGVTAELRFGDDFVVEVPVE